jgi:hypothetical protein
MWTLIIPLVAGEERMEHRIDYPTQQECRAARTAFARDYARVVYFLYPTIEYRAAVSYENDQPPGVDVRWGYEREEVGYCIKTEARLSREGR